MAGTVRATMTVETFLRLPKTESLVELVDGECVVMNVANPLRQKLVASLILSLWPLLPPGGALRGSPDKVYLDERHIFQPEIFWKSAQNTHCKLTEECWHGAPDLVIEIFSPGIERRDKDAKFGAYDRHGVLEYWMIDPVAAYIEVWALSHSNCIRLPLKSINEEFVSPVLYYQSIAPARLFKNIKFA